MVTRYAMVPDLGHATYDSEPVGFFGHAAPGLEARSYSEETAREIDCAVREILDRAYAKARDVVAENRALLDEGAEQLLATETLNEAQLETLFGKLRRRAATAAPRPATAAS